MTDNALDVPQQEPIWILQIQDEIGKRGGVYTFLINYYRNIDRSKIQFAFAGKKDNEFSSEDELLALGGRVHYLPSMRERPVLYMRELRKLIKSHPEYRIVHSHMNQRNGISLLSAAAQKTPVRISHAHNVSNAKTLPEKLRFLILKSLTKHMATHFMACSEAANASYHYREYNAYIIQNAIETEKFTFSPAIRKSKREEYGLDDKTVLGTVGNFSEQKNIPFLFEILKKLPDNYVLMLVGDGENRKNIETMCRQMGLNDRAIFTGFLPNPAEVLQAMDVFVFPSLYEGLGFAAVEAQASGLRVIASTGVPNAADITDNVVHLPLSEGAEYWAEYIYSLPSEWRKDNSQAIISAGFDMSSNAKRLEDIYTGLYKSSI